MSFSWKVDTPDSLTATLKAAEIYSNGGTLDEAMDAGVVAVQEVQKEQVIMSGELATDRYLNAVFAIRSGKRPIGRQEKLDCLVLFPNDDILGMSDWKKLISE